MLWWIVGVSTVVPVHNVIGPKVWVATRGGQSHAKNRIHIRFHPCTKTVQYAGNFRTVMINIYTNGKKKQCIVKMLITHKICSRWAWKFIKMMSPIHTFNYQTLTRFHECLVRRLFFFLKLHFMSSATEKQLSTKLIDAKRKFLERMIRKPLYFC